MNIEFKKEIPQNKMLAIQIKFLKNYYQESIKKDSFISSKDLKDQFERCHPMVKVEGNFYKLLKKAIHHCFPSCNMYTKKRIKFHDSRTERGYYLDFKNNKNDSYQFDFSSITKEEIVIANYLLVEDVNFSFIEYLKENIEEVVEGVSFIASSDIYNDYKNKFEISVEEDKIFYKNLKIGIDFLYPRAMSGSKKINNIKKNGYFGLKFKSKNIIK